MDELNDFAGLGQAARARREDRSRRYYKTGPRVIPPPVLDPRVIPGKTAPRTTFDPYAYRAPPPPPLPPPPPATGGQGVDFTNPVWVEPTSPFRKGAVVFAQPSPKVAPRAPAPPPAPPPATSGKGVDFTNPVWVEPTSPFRQGSVMFAQPAPRQPAIATRASGLSGAPRPRLVTEYAEAYIRCREANSESRLRAKGIWPFTPEDPCWDVWRIHDPDRAAVALQKYKAEKAYQAKIKETDERARLAKIRAGFPGKSMTVAPPLTVSPRRPAEQVPIPWPNRDGLEYRMTTESPYRPRSGLGPVKSPFLRSGRLYGVEGEAGSPAWVLVALGFGFWLLS